MTVTATLSEGARSTQTTVALSDSGAGTATSGTDYTAITGKNLVIPANKASANTTITVTVTDDIDDERDETIRISGAATGFTTATADFTITDNDTPTDYDTDNDGLIEVDSAAKLNAVRWDLDGDGAADNAADNTTARYQGAFRTPALDQCDNPATTGTTETCGGYELTADIDLNVAPYNTGSGWEPIAPVTGESGFETELGGNGHTISGLFVNRLARGNEGGLFGWIDSDGEVWNLILDGVSVRASAGAGGLAAENDGDVSRVFVSGTVQGGDDEVGGLVGLNDSDGWITWSASTATVRSDSEVKVGGLVGSNRGLLNKAYASGAVTAPGTQVGGLVGHNHTGTGTTNSFNKGISNVYARGAVTGTGTKGGLVGVSEGGAADASYWDTQASGVSTSALGTGLTTAQLQAPTAATGVYQGWEQPRWDFGNQVQYPVLNAMPLSVAAQRGVTITLSVNDTSIAESEAAATTVTITATLSDGATASADTTVTLSLDGSATSGTDYTVPATLPSITISSGESSGTATLAITPVNDTAWEPDELIIIRAAGAAPAVITLTSEDKPNIVVSASPSVIGEGAGPIAVTITATLEGPLRATPTPVTWRYDASSTAGQPGGGEYTVSLTNLGTDNIPANGRSIGGT